MPSYGPGGDLGKEARWFGKTTEETRRKQFAEATRRKRISNWRKSPRSGFSARKGFLIFLLIACLVAAIYTGYLLFTHRTGATIGAIIFVADIGALIWNISALRKWRVGTGTIVAVAVIIALLGATTAAFAGIKPFSTAKSEVVAWFQKAPSQPSEQPLPSSPAPAPSPPSISPSPQPSPQPAPVPQPKPTPQLGVPKLSGSYIGTYMGVTWLYTFIGDRVVCQCSFGTATCKYEIYDGGTKIRMTDVVSGSVSEEDFHYDQPTDTFSIGRIGFVRYKEGE